MFLLLSDQAFLIFGCEKINAHDKITANILKNQSLVVGLGLKELEHFGY